MTSAETKARLKIIEIALKMSESKLSPGRSGNVSCRWDGGMLITPTAMPYHLMQADDIVFVSDEGVFDAEKRKPSTEWPFHQTVYEARGDAGAVVHCHSLNATALACLNKNIPAFHYMVAIAGGNHIPLVPYATFGTKKLAKLIKSAIKDRSACLLANHGQIAFGNTLDSAFELAVEVETLASQYVAALSVDEPKILSDAEMRKVLKKFYDYGK